MAVGESVTADAGGILVGCEVPGEKAPQQDSKPRLIKEGCAERIARSGTLSQNGYGDRLSRRAGTYPVQSICGGGGCHSGGV